MTERQLKDLDYIEDRIVFYTGIDIRKNTRKREYVYARMVFIKIMREEFMMTLETIGKYLGRAHCTVVYALKNWDTIESYEPKYYKVYQYILLEMESEQIFIGRKPIGERRNIEQDILRVRKTIKDAVERLQIA